MRIVLVNIRKPSEVRIPQGLLYLASVITNSGHEAVIYDEPFTKDLQTSLDTILSHDAEMVGFSVYSVPWQLKRIEQLSASIKAISPETLILWGGWHATLYPQHSILNEYVDIVVRGPAEKSIIEILENSGERNSLKNTTGLLYKERTQIVETGPMSIDDEFLFPQLNFNLIDVPGYFKAHDRGKGVLQYITTRGCTARCRFCIMANTYKSRLVRKPQKQIFKELQYLLAHHPVDTIHFSDDNTFANERQALQLCDTVRMLTKGREISWRCATRINTLCTLSREAYRQLAESRLEGVVVGIESGVDRVLKLMGKGITVSQVERALTCLVDSGLEKNLFSFLFDFTGETEKEAIETLQMVCKTRLLLPKSTIMLHVYFPGASDSSFMPLEIAHSAPASELFEKYYNEHIRNYRVGRTPIEILRHYINASQQTEKNTPRGFSLLRRIQQMIIRMRIKYGIFILPFEYYLARGVIQKIRKLGKKNNEYG